MDVWSAMNMTLDEIKSKYKEYLRLQALSKNTVQTASNDAFYLWKNESKELFWEKMLSPDFETVYRAAMLDSLSKRTKGNPQKLVSSYISSARRFRKFLESDTVDVKATNPPIKTTRKKKINAEIPAPCVSEVERYLARWDELEQYHLQEEALDKLFFTLCPENKDISDVLLKVSTLNDFYSTNIYSVYPVAKHITSLDIDVRLKAGDVTLVGDIQRVVINDAEINFYSFATKYCSHHNPLEYPIYDSYVEKVLKYFRDLDGFAEFKNVDLKNYIRFKGILIDFRRFYRLEQFNLKKIDKYIWQLGKTYFPKNFGKKK